LIVTSLVLKESNRLVYLLNHVFLGLYLSVFDLSLQDPAESADICGLELIHSALKTLFFPFVGYAVKFLILRFDNLKFIVDFQGNFLLLLQFIEEISLEALFLSSFVDKRDLLDVLVRSHTLSTQILESIFLIHAVPDLSKDRHSQHNPRSFTVENNLSLQLVRHSCC
jgi:hypothetical protein